MERYPPFESVRSEPSTQTLFAQASAEVDAKALAWARDRAEHPFVLSGGEVRCLFCANVSMLTWDGTVEARHGQNCLAVQIAAFKQMGVAT